MLQVSLEAIQDQAARVRAGHVSHERALAAGEPGGLGRAPDAARLSRAYPQARATSTSLAVLVAEAVTLDALRKPLRAYESAWSAHPVVLPGEPALPPRALPSVLALETNEHRRAALSRAADGLAKDLLPHARSVAEVLRTTATTLGLDAPEALHMALGLGHAGVLVRVFDAVMEATDDAFRELSAWVRPRAGLTRSGSLRWDETIRTLALPRATELVPQGDRGGIASRWIARIGLDEVLGRIRDETQRAGVVATGVRALSEDPGVRAFIAGTPTVAAVGATQMAGALGEAIAWVIPRDEEISARLGVDRLHHAVAQCIGRRLFLEPTFVTREATVDRGAREPVMLEFVYAEIFTTRVDAALGRFVHDALSREKDLPGRLREYLQRALDCAPAPAWAAHVFARAVELRPGARALAALAEPVVRTRLREAHDEDWFRNPRAGESLRATLDAMRTLGTLRALGGEPDVTRDVRETAPAGESESRPEMKLEPGPLAARFAEAIAAARR